MNIIDINEKHWLSYVVDKVNQDGYAVVLGVLDESFLNETREKMKKTQKQIHDEIGVERLKKQGELGGILRNPMKYDTHYFKFLEIPAVLQVVDRLISPTAVMHLQNALLLPSFPDKDPSVFQNNFHPDIRRVLNKFLIGLNIMFPIDEYKKENGGTKIVPGTHQQEIPPSVEYLEKNSISVECPGGSMIVFDSTLWHSAGLNRSGKDRHAINHIYTPSYIKPQMDHVRHLGNDVVLAQKPRTQQLLGWYTRVPTTLDEFYQPSEERFYRAGQG